MLTDRHGDHYNAPSAFSWGVKMIGVIVFTNLKCGIFVCNQWTVMVVMTSSIMKSWNRIRLYPCTINPTKFGEGRIKKMLKLSCSQAFDYRQTDRHYDYNTPRCRGIKTNVVPSLVKSLIFCAIGTYLKWIKFHAGLIFVVRFSAKINPTRNLIPLNNLIIFNWIFN